MLEKIRKKYQSMKRNSRRRRQEKKAKKMLRNSVDMMTCSTTSEVDYALGYCHGSADQALADGKITMDQHSYIHRVSDFVANEKIKDLRAE